jgi:hypothetical protein
LSYNEVEGVLASEFLESAKRKLKMRGSAGGDAGVSTAKYVSGCGNGACSAILSLSQWQLRKGGKSTLNSEIWRRRLRDVDVD